MPLVAGKVWTSRRRWMGNIIPALLSVPFAVVGVLLYRSDQPLWGPSLWFLIAFVIVGWLGVCLFGFYQNDRMRSEMGRKLDRAHDGRQEERFFVGCARPSFRSVLDAHEDVGFLIVHPEELEFFGDSIQLKIDRASVQRIRYRPNPHTYVGLGRWVSIEGTSEGKPIRFMVEPREKSTLMGNRAFGKKLRTRLEDWLKGNGPQA